MSIGPWQPLWLGESDRQLYAALHRPGLSDAERGVLLVPPLLHEQPRSRRFITEVASAFAALGIAALRFDFYGTGDSCGRSDELRLSTMHEDMHRASTALRSHTGVSKLAIIAWRAGGLVAWDWLRNGGSASELILWEPILEGRAWLDDLVRADAIERCSPDRYTGSRPIVADSSDGQLMGYAVAPELRDAMAQLAMTSESAPLKPLWLIDRAASLESHARCIASSRALALADDAPQFGGSTRMDESLFMSSRMERWVDELARTMARSD